jgi:HEAT repeat protein
MEISQIQTCLESSDPQDRMRAITALRFYDAEVAVPLLMERINDPEIIIRSFVAMGLGRKQTSRAFAALLELLQYDRDTNVRAEAANSLSMYGEAAVPYLMQAFQQNSQWVIRVSILVVLAELNCPEVLLEVCLQGLADFDFTVRDVAIDQLPYLVGTPQEQAALQQLLFLAQSDRWQTRRQVALALRKFTAQPAQAALLQLRQDQDYRVVGATLEALVLD